MTLCACSTGPATANVRATGVPLSEVLMLADMDADVNTLKVVGSDGYGVKVPLSYALDKKAMIVYRINDEAVPSGTESGRVSKLASNLVFDVQETQI